ncbi:MAG: hypothetical protein FJX72_13550 [Armatimonadetes bacterium]|nr:hypothetical protein [Armatimonadota bacterium]
MDTLDPIPPEIERLFEASEARRKRLAALPWEEKIRMVIELQRMAAPIQRARGRNVTPWEPDDPPAERQDTDTDTGRDEPG